MTVSLIARWLHLICGVLLLGSLVLLFLSLRAPTLSAAAARWRNRLTRAALAWALLFLLSALGNLWAQLISVSEAASINIEELRKLLQTRFGAAWLARVGLLLVLIMLLLPRAAVTTRRAGWAIALAAAALSITAIASHAAALEPAWPPMLAHAVHLLSVGAWFGALPALLWLLLAARRDAALVSHVREIFPRFSALALFCVCAIVVSGAPLADLQVERTPWLIGTDYGQRLLSKLALVALMWLVAAQLRWRYLPRLLRGADGSAHQRIARWVALEFALGLGALWLANKLTQSVPARHDAALWPFQFRFALDATWDKPGVQDAVLLGVALCVAGCLAAAALQRIGARRSVVVAAALAALGVGAYFAAPPLTVEAYPETYRRSTVAYQAISIANGAQLFRQHCVACHGAAAHGDGALARELAFAPANLTEPHTAEHTAGDMFWWLTHGMRRGMPGFAQQTSEDERWDLINFLRALSSGYQARILSERVVPKRPWLGAPDFSFETEANSSIALKDFRFERNVLLVFFDADSRARLDALANWHAQARPSKLEIIAVALDPQAAPTTKVIAYTVLRAGTEEIARTYALLARTLTRSQSEHLVPLMRHTEFLIDRFGYVRARALGGFTQRDLPAQLATLNAEGKVAPPPDEHVH